ncbi:MAG: four helix bundle protein [Desulfobacteraceae bacterium]|nr:four helix bundle protein [Desulfobacteraceae bacterium]MCF8112077.1 four helix bundle protein [Desulfobacteraceae bacterium]
MDEVRSVQDLDVFQKAHNLTLKLYEVTARFPGNEKYALVDQIRRAASSIGANLFEGGYRSGSKEFSHFCNISRGSAGEVKYFMLLSRDLGYIPSEIYEEVNNQLDDISRMLYGLMKSLKQS